MPNNELSQAQVEAVFAAMARALDAAGPQGREAYLARLALLLVEALGDDPRALACIQAAAQNPR